MAFLKRTTTGLATAVLMCGLVACGSGDTEDASPSGLPLEESTETTAGDSPTTTVLDPDAAEAGSDSSVSDTPATPAITADMLESMMATENGRALLVDGIAAETNLDPVDAECLIDAIPVEFLVEAAGAFLGTQGEAGLFPAEQMAEVEPLLASCGIDPASLLP